MRLGLRESWKRVMEAERSGSETEAELYLLRAFEGLDRRRFGGCSGGSLVAGTEPRRIFVGFGHWDFRKARPIAVWPVQYFCEPTVIPY